MGFEHALYGGLALAAYGEPRETKDADVVVLDANGELAASALGAAGVLTSVAFERTRFGGLWLTRVTLLGDGAIDGINVVDLVQPRSPRFARSVLDRAISAPLRGRPIRVVSPEDFVLLKVLSTRAKDLEDAASVLRSEADTIDAQLLASEVDRLAEEIGGHDVSGRWRSVQELVAAGR